MVSVIVHVEVETEPDGELVIRWEVEGDPVAVDVATGFSADHMDHRHETTVEAGRTTLVLPGRPAGRLFVSVSPHGGGSAVVAVDRRVPFEGVTNFRDLGGYRTASGARIAWGQVFRADALHGLSREDLTLYDLLGLRAVYDLRGDKEIEERPNPIPSLQLTIIGRPAGSEPPSAESWGASEEDGQQILHEMYVGLIDHAAVQIGQLFGALAEPGGLPAVFHCHAGKDRTGIVAALLLVVLGVERSTVLDDYELTARYRLRAHQDTSFQRLVEAGLSPEAAAGVLTTPRWAMQQALEDLESRYGTVEDYLLGPAGMRPDQLQTLRQLLLQQPG